MDVIISAPGYLRLQLPQEDWLDRYDVIAIARSRNGVGGPYVELTATEWQPARLQVPQRSGYDVLGKSLELLLDDGVAVAVTFTGTSMSEVMSVLALAMPGYLAVAPVAAGGFTVGTVNVGIGAYIEVVGGDAAPLLGLPVGVAEHGRSACTRLVAGKTDYLFVDPYGRPTDYYQVRLINNTMPVGTGWVYSSFSGALRNPLPSERLIPAVIELHDAAGNAVEGALVSLYTSQRCQQDNVYSTAVDFRTDSQGRGRCFLCRGLQMTLSISGTNVAREVLIPVVGDSVDLLDPRISVDNDAYKVQVPDLVIGERRTL